MAKNEKTTNSRGGARTGAGRTAMFENKVRKTIDFEEAIVTEIEQEGRTISEFAREAVTEKLNRLRAYKLRRKEKAA